MANLLAQGAEPDFTVLKYLHTPRTALDFVVPEAWKKFVHPSGFAALGWLKEWVDLRWVLPLFLVGLIGLFYPYQFESFDCSKDNIVSLTVRDTTYYFCLNDKFGRLIYIEQLLHREIETRLFDKADSAIISEQLRLKTDSIIKLMAECHRNFAVDYYHLAKYYYENNQQDSVCWALEQANRHDYLDLDIQQARRDVCGIKLSADIVFEQDYEPYKENNLYGYRNRQTKKNLIPPQYPDAHNFMEGLAAVKQGKTWGFIDTKNTMVIAPQFGFAYGFAEGMCLMADNTTRFGYIDKTGKIQIPPQYEMAERFKNGIARVKNKVNDAWLCIDKTGKTVDCAVQSVANTPSVSTPKDSTQTTVLVPVMVAIKGGTFQMGSNENDDEKPIHSVTLRDFSIGKFEVTVEQYLQFCNETNTNLPEWLEEGNDYHIETGKKTYYKDLGYKRKGSENLPIVGISWYDATAYAQWLSSKTGKKYRLLTEAEWEYAARGGNKSKGFTYSGSNTVGDVAWYDENSDNKTHAVGGKQANELGLYDMSGNVWEWCADQWHDNYKGAPKEGSAWLGEKKGTNRVLRGGSWFSTARHCRSANRHGYAPSYRYNAFGFRLSLIFPSVQ